MSFKQNDVVEFDDGTKVLVIDAILYENEEYVFVNQVLQENEFVKEYKVMVADYSTGSLKKIIDPEMLQVLLPQFEYRLKKQLQQM